MGRGPNVENISSQNLSSKKGKNAKNGIRGLGHGKGALKGVRLIRLGEDMFCPKGLGSGIG